MTTDTKPLADSTELVKELRRDAKGYPYCAEMRAAATITALLARVGELEAGLSFYANPEIYKPHPHGPTFERRDLSFRARALLEGTDNE